MAELEPLYTSEEMKAAEAGHDVEQLMERAGRAVADLVLRDFPAAREITVVAGGGHNGGDARIAGRLLEDAGRSVRVVDAKAEGDDDLGSPDVVVDGIFGTGFSGEPRPEAARLIERINAVGAPVVAVDVPSGVDASTGEVAGECVDAAATVTFHGEKVGLRVAPGTFHAGAVEVAGIGLAPQETRARRVTAEILTRVPLRRAQDNKYTAGSVAVVGGAPGTTGAVRLAAEAAFRADAGYVTVVVPDNSLPVVEQQLLEPVKRSLSALPEVLERTGAVAVGPGLGRGEEAKAVVAQVLASDLPVVVDADALFELEPFERRPPTVLTPHSGELGRLLGEDSAWVDAHRLEAAQRGADAFHAICLLKGADTIVAAPGEGPLVCDLGTPALATAGSGDVLTGIVGAFLAKGMDARLAAAAGAAAQQVAARLSDFQAGLIASDVAHNLPHVFDYARYANDD